MTTNSLISALFLGTSLFMPASVSTDLHKLSGLDRCQAPHCLCPVDVPWEPVPMEVQESRRSIDIEFSEGSSVIDPSQRAELEAFLKGAPPGSTLTLTGMTDGCGEPGHNEALAGERVASVVTVLSGRGLRIRSRSTGERVSGHDPASRRVSIVLSWKQESPVDLSRLEADVYLVDASGSAARYYKKWMTLIAAARPRGSEVFLSRSLSCTPGDWRGTYPAGGTEIWYSYWALLERMERGDRLIIVSDFNSTYPLSPSEAWRLEERVTGMGVTVRAISP